MINEIKAANEATAEFDAVIRPWLDGLDAVAISYIAAKARVDLRLARARAVVLTKGTQPPQPFRFETKHLLAEVRTVALGTGLSIFLAEAKAGRLPLGDYKLDLAPQSPHEVKLYSNAVSEHGKPAWFRQPYLLVRVDKAVSDIWGCSELDLDWEVKGAAQPFDSVAELFSRLFLNPTAWHSQPPSFEIHISPPATFRPNCAIKDGIASIEVLLAGGLATDLVDVGFATFSSAGAVRATVSRTGFTWTDTNDGQLGRVTFDAAGAVAAQCFLSFGGTAVCQRVVVDPQRVDNPRFALHDYFDPDGQILRAYLVEGHTKGSAARDFEWGVALLLHLMGFSIAYYGANPQTTERPDIVAMAPSGNAAVVECTTRLLTDQNKLPKLVERTAALQELLGKHAQGHLRILPVIVTALPRNEIQGSLDQAQKDRVLVLCREDLVIALDVLRRLPAADEWLQRGFAAVGR